jgi:hypothetical protein
MFNGDPDQMTADDRLDEIAALLAAGFLRWKRRTGCLPSADMPPLLCPEESSKISPHSTGTVSKSLAECPPR